MLKQYEDIKAAQEEDYMRKLDEFDARYKVEPSPNGLSWHVADTAERCIAAGPYPSEYKAKEILTFMRQHVGVTTR